MDRKAKTDRSDHVSVAQGLTEVNRTGDGIAVVARDCAPAAPRAGRHRRRHMSKTLPEAAADIGQVALLDHRRNGAVG